MVELKLDTNALDALFPEGTELRLKLQQGVLEEVSRRLIRGVSEESLRGILAPILAKVNVEIEREIQRLYIEKTGYLTGRAHVTLRPEVQEQIRHSVSDAAYSIVKDEVSKTAVVLEPTVKLIVERNLRIMVKTELKGMLDAELEEMKPYIQEKVKAMVLSVVNL